MWNLGTREEDGVKHHEHPPGRTRPLPGHLLEGQGAPLAPSQALQCERAGSKPPARSKFLPLSALSPSREQSFCREQTLAMYLGVTDSPPRNVSPGLFSLILC